MKFKSFIKSDNSIDENKLSMFYDYLIENFTSVNDEFINSLKILITNSSIRTTNKWSELDKLIKRYSEIDNLINNNWKYVMRMANNSLKEKRKFKHKLNLKIQIMNDRFPHDSESCNKTNGSFDYDHMFY